MDNPRPCTSKAKKSESKPTTNVKLCETVNNSDSDGYEVEGLDELEETDYLSAEQEITLPEPQPERRQKRKGQAT
jgi:hypothetical protein